MTRDGRQHIAEQQLEQKVDIIERKVTAIESYLYKDEATGKDGIIKTTEDNKKLLNKILITVDTTKTYLKWTLCLFGFTITSSIAIITIILSRMM